MFIFVLFYFYFCFFCFFFFFFFNDTATTEIYTLSYTTLFRSPRVSFSHSRLWRWSSSTSGNSGLGGVSSEASNIENWSSLAPLRPLVDRSTALACTASMAAREGQTLSNAPHFMRDSSVRLL